MAKAAISFLKLVLVTIFVITGCCSTKRLHAQTAPAPKVPVIHSWLTMKECEASPKGRMYYTPTGAEVSKKDLRPGEKVYLSGPDMCAEVHLPQFESAVVVKLKKGTSIVYLNGCLPKRLAAGGYRIFGWEPIFSGPEKAIDPSSSDNDDDDEDPTSL